jgi:hypothetical protein
MTAQEEITSIANSTMNSKGAKKLLLAAAIVSAIGISASNVLAQSLNTIETTVAGGTSGITLGSDPVITAILSEPGTFNGLTYTSWGFLVSDGTGSIDIYGKLPSGSTYVPTVGDSITATGEYDPYEQLPELESLTSISLVSSGNSVPSVGVSTIPTLNQSTLPYGVAGYLWTLDDVTISGLSITTFGTADETGEITDGDGNSMELYYYPKDYSLASDLSGTAVPTSPVDMTGFVSVYDGTAQFTVMSIATVPEPATLALCGLGGLALLVLRRRNS